MQTSLTTGGGSSLQQLGTGILTVLNNVGTEAPAIMTLVNALAYVFGLFFLVMGLLMMYKTAKGTSKHQSGGWFWSLTIAILLLALPTTMAAIGGTLFGGYGNTSPLAYSSMLNGNLGSGSCALRGIRPLLAVYGVIAVIRGLIVYRAVGMYGVGEKNTISRATILCISGLMLVHLDLTLQLANSLTGLKMGAGLC